MLHYLYFVLSNLSIADLLLKHANKHTMWWIRKIIAPTIIGDINPCLTEPLFVTQLTKRGVTPMIFKLNHPKMFILVQNVN